MMWAFDGTAAALRRKTDALKAAEAAERMAIYTTEQRIKAEHTPPKNTIATLSTRRRVAG
jgi:hypothetical protein